MMKFKRLIAGAVLSCSGIFPAATAAAGPDPHIPDPMHNYCPGGGMGSMLWLGYCDGERYPDGSYWHQVQNGLPMIDHPAGFFGVPMECVVDNGTPVPAPAPPGGCGGAAGQPPTNP